MLAMTRTTVRDEFLASLHDEITRLPENLRLAVVLCDLQGIPQAKAAGELQWSERTLRRRLANARQRLRARLLHRGPLPAGLLMAELFRPDALDVVSEALSESTARAALAAVSHDSATGAISNSARALAYEMLKTMVIRKLVLASLAFLGVGLVAWAASTELVSRVDGHAGSALEPNRLASRATPTPISA